MNPFNWIFKDTSELGKAGLPAIFNLALKENEFVKSDILNTYSMILTDTFERTQGLTDEQTQALPDSYVKSGSPSGLISLLSNAMATLGEIYIVYKAGVVRLADDKEKEQIKKDYDKKAESKVGIFVSFKCYPRTERLRIFSALEYCVLCSLNKTMHISKAMQVKIDNVRASVSLQDSSIAIDQARDISKALGDGMDVLMDAKDVIVTATPDTSSSEKAIAFLENKKAFILSLPLSYVNGQQTAGIGSTGEADMRAIERGLRQYFASIVQPVCRQLFGAEVVFKSLDFRDLNSAIEASKAMTLIDDSVLPPEYKVQIMSRVWDFNLDELQNAIDALPEPDPVTPPGGNNGNIDPNVLDRVQPSNP